MKAETAYHVIKALPKEEVPRLYRMLGIEAPKVKVNTKKKKKKKLLTDAEAQEYLSRIFNERRKRNNQSLL